MIKKYSDSVPDTRGKIVVYVGNDDSYWDQLRGKIKENHYDLGVSFIRMDYKGNLNVLELFVALVKARPRVIYIDLSEGTKNCIFLSQMVTREPSLEDASIVGLVEDKEQVRSVLSAGVDFVHIKCGEFCDVVYDPMYLAFPEAVPEQKFARGKYSRDVTLINDFRMGFITKTSIHCEGNLKLRNGQEVSIDNEIPDSNVPSSKFTVSNIGERNLYYGYRYFYDMDFVFVDPPIPPEPMKDDGKKKDGDTSKKEKDDKGLTMSQKERAEKERKEKENEEKAEAESRQIEYQEKLASFQYDLKIAKKRHAEWIDDKAEVSTPKKTKISIIDKELHVLTNNNASNLNNYPYSLRVYTYLKVGSNQLKSFSPDIIAMQIFSEAITESRESAVFKQCFEELEDIGFDYKNDNDEIMQENDDGSDSKSKSMTKKRIIEMKNKEMTNIADLIEEVKAVKDFNPFIVIYNCSFETSRSLQKFYDYQMLFVNPNLIEMDSILKMADMMEEKNEEKITGSLKSKVDALKKKNPAKYSRVRVEDFIESKYYIRQTNKLSHVSYNHTVELTGITESSCTFVTEEELEPRTYRMDFPVEMSIRIVPVDGKLYVESQGKKEYFALIHSISELDKRDIRRFVYEIFFEPIKEQRDKEMEEWESKKQEVIEQRTLESEESAKNLEASSEEDDGDAVNLDDKEGSGEAPKVSEELEDALDDKNQQDEKDDRQAS